MIQRRLRLSMQDNVWEHAIVVKKSECTTVILVFASVKKHLSINHRILWQQNEITPSGIVF